MSRRGWLNSTQKTTLFLALGLTAGCESAHWSWPQPASDGSARRAAAIASHRLAQDDPPPKPSDVVPSRPVRPTETQPAPVEEIYLQIPDPVRVQEAVEHDLDHNLKNAKDDQDRQSMRDDYTRRTKSIDERIAQVERPEVARLTLADALRRALQNNYALQFHAYNPAIERTRIVEAEAAFDAVFFTRFNYNKQDRPSSSELVGTQSDNRVFESGVRKLLSTGMQVQASYALTRTHTNLVFQTLNPSYFNQFIVEFRQPLLRGFGTDFNRSQIELSRLDHRISTERFKREIRETIFNVEQAYWRLYQARRRVAVNARLLADLELVYNWLDQRYRAGYDVTEIELNLTRTRIERYQVQYIQFGNDLRNAEDAIKALLNDPELHLARDVEIMPVDAPAFDPVIIDQLGEVAAALQFRSELREAKLAIEQAAIAIGAAKNQALPKLDVIFRYIVDGLGGTAHSAFSQLSENDFHEYLISLELEWPIGNRGPEAALRRARLQQAQAIAAHRAQIESVFLEVNQVIRDIQNAYDQIGPSLRAARASQDQLNAIRAKQEKRDPPNLEVELNAHEALATAREFLAQVIANYNIALVDLERKKGTLLRYNNIVIRGLEDDDAHVGPAHATMP